jgi:CheY-like chemotaxis protein
LAGLTVLVVEDEPIVAMMIEDMLEELGCAVAGPATSVGQALDLVVAGGFGAAVLDVNLNGERSDPVALALDRLAIPYLYATGYGASAVPGATRPVLQKPYTIEQLAAALEQVRR